MCEKRESRKIVGTRAMVQYVLREGGGGADRLSILCFYALALERTGAGTNEINFHFEQTNERKKNASDLIVLRSLFAIKISRLRSRVQITLLGCAAEIYTHTHSVARSHFIGFVGHGDGAVCVRV